MTLNKKLLVSMVSFAAFGLSACNGTMPTMGDSGGNTVTGGVSGSSSANKNSALESCPETLGALSVFEDRDRPWWGRYSSRYPRLGSTIPLIRAMVQQSNCFVIVERGKAMAAMTKERELMNSGQIRSGSNFGKGQMVAADFTMSPSVQFAEKGTGGAGGLLGGFVGVVAGAVKKNEASTSLLLIDNRSGVQISAAMGNAKNYDFRLFGGFFAGLLVGGGGYSNTPEGKIISASFADSYNNMVKSLRNYKAQTVKGGLGKGGQLKIGG